MVRRKGAFCVRDAKEKRASCDDVIFVLRLITRTARWRIELVSAEMMTFSENAAQDVRQGWYISAKK